MLSNERIVGHGSEGWEAYVARPVDKYPISTMQARAILEFFGQMAYEGVNLDKLLHDLVRKEETGV